MGTIQHTSNSESTAAGKSLATFEKWLEATHQRLDDVGAVSLGVSYSDLNVFGDDAEKDFQRTVANYPLAYLNHLRSKLGRKTASRAHILRNGDGLVRSGQMLLVLGRPGSGCSTLLRTLAGQTHSLHVQNESKINYQGIDSKSIRTEFRGQCTYQADTDVHFPNLTLDQTLAVADKASGRNRSVNLHPADQSNVLEDISGYDAILSSLGLSDQQNTKVGGDFVTGLSGGERKRTSIAEVIINGSTIQLWDNSTRGLDSANALRFVRILRALASKAHSTIIVSLYQASEEIFNLFDKIAVLYEGRQIFFGDVASARPYFVKLGFEPHDRASTPDFLTSLTNPAERLIRNSLESVVPTTSDTFASMWENSHERKDLRDHIKTFDTRFGPCSEHAALFRRWQQRQKSSRRTASQSPFSIRFTSQLSICMMRGLQRLRGNFVPQVSNIAGNCIISIILGTMFFDLKEDTSSIYGRGVLLFFTVLLNTFLGAFEGVALWEQRPIVEKHFQYAFYHPSAEAVSSMLCDMPNKLVLTLFFNVPFYFMANLRRDAASFFTFYVFAFASLLTGSMLFRTIGAMSRNLTQSIAPGAVFIMLLIVYTGFILPIPSMPVWLSWFRYINPTAYVFESLMINEFAGRSFLCVNLVPQGPSYATVPNIHKQCPVVGAEAGATLVEGSNYIQQSFRYSPENKWNNLGIVCAFAVFLCILYLLATEYVAAERSKGEVLIFHRNFRQNLQRHTDIEAKPCQNKPVNKSFGTCQSGLEGHKEEANQLRKEYSKPTLSWYKLGYQIDSKSSKTVILDDVEGWVKPGTLTALMGSSGAGKTTLLNVLANRVSVGIVSGIMLDEYGLHPGSDLNRMVGYAQQQDIHLATATVKEALRFSALLRQPQECPDIEKLAYVEEVIDILDMRDFADAVIGLPGEGLNVEQRKRVTIGVELAAKPQLLLFLDEPTSGLDSDTAWSVCTLLRKLAKQGQSILCTIHQPSGVLFEMFDCLLLLSKGRSLYFGDIGVRSSSVVRYFEARGARSCERNENPAEWLLEITTNTNVNWAQMWRESDERRVVVDAITKMESTAVPKTSEQSLSSSKHFATTFLRQLRLVIRRTLNNDWRTPSYLYSKLFLFLGMSFFNGFSFYQSENSLQGVQNQLFSVFMLMTAFGNVVQLIMPQFLKSRDIYEGREQRSRTYSWKVFVLSNVIAEIPSQTLMAVVFFVTWYYPLGMYHNALATDQLHARGGLVFLLIWSFMLFCSSFSQMVATVMPDAATGVNIASLFFSLSLMFCGVLVSPSALPGFWMFMYRATPVTYFVSALISTGIGGVNIVCSRNELLTLSPPPGQTCGSYLAEYVSFAGGTLLNPDATSNCNFCAIASTNALLVTLDIDFADRWRNFGISLCYTAINVLGALGLFWVFRVPKGPKRM